MIYNEDIWILSHLTSREVWLDEALLGYWLSELSLQHLQPDDGFVDGFLLPACKQLTAHFSDPLAINLDILWTKIFINNPSVNGNLCFELGFFQGSLIFSFFLSLVQIAMQFPPHFFKILCLGWIEAEEDGDEEQDELTVFDLVLI